MHINDQGGKLDYGMKVYSKLCPTPGMYGESSGFYDDGILSTLSWGGVTSWSVLILTGHRMLLRRH